MLFLGVNLLARAISMGEPGNESEREKSVIANDIEMKGAQIHSL